MSERRFHGSIESIDCQNCNVHLNGHADFVYAYNCEIHVNGKVDFLNRYTNQTPERVFVGADTERVKTLERELAEAKATIARMQRERGADRYKRLYNELKKENETLKREFSFLEGDCKRDMESKLRKIKQLESEKKYLNKEIKRQGEARGLQEKIDILLQVNREQAKRIADLEREKEKKDKEKKTRCYEPSLGDIYYINRNALVFLGDDMVDIADGMMPERWRRQHGLKI